MIYIWSIFNIGVMREMVVDEQKEILPIQFKISEDRLHAQFKVHVQRDGEPIGIKVGGAYYSGGDVTLQDLFYGHTPEFNGTIGFRCAFVPE